MLIVEMNETGMFANNWLELKSTQREFETNTVHFRQTKTNNTKLWDSPALDSFKTVQYARAQKKIKINLSKNYKLQEFANTSEFADVTERDNRSVTEFHRRRYNPKALADSEENKSIVDYPKQWNSKTYKQL